MIKQILLVFPLVFGLLVPLHDQYSWSSHSRKIEFGFQIPLKGAGNAVIASGSPPTFDATAQTSNSSPASPTTFTHTCTGTNLVLLVWIALRTNTANSSSACSYNSVAMTDQGEIATTASPTAQRVKLWTLVNPATGANTVSCTFSAGSSIGIIAASFKDANQGTSFGTPVTNSNATSNTTATATVTSASSELVAAGVVNSVTGTFTPGTGITQVGTTYSPTNLGGAAGYQTGASSTSVSWTVPSGKWAVNAIAIKGL